MRRGEEALADDGVSTTASYTPREPGIITSLAHLA